MSSSFFLQRGESFNLIEQYQGTDKYKLWNYMLKCKINTETRGV
jgi:hypothetical protein